MPTPTLQNYYDVSSWMYGYPDSDALPPVPDNLDPFFYTTDSNGQGVYDSGLQADGFHAAAFVTEGSDPNIVIGFEGTDIAGLEERPLFLLAQIEADVDLYYNTLPQALKDATAFVQSVIDAASAQNIPLENITVTGHSLGASIAAYAAAQAGLGGTTFAATGLPEGAIPTGAVSTLTNYVEIGDPIGNYSATPTNYEGPFLYDDDIMRFGGPTYIGSDFDELFPEVLRDALGDAGAQFAPGSTLEDRAAGLAAFGALAATYHPLTVYGGDLSLDTSGIQVDASRTIGNGLDYFLLYNDIVDRYRLVDDAFYQITNPDVRQAGVDAEQHFFNGGWQEGRDPNALFSTVGYLAANPDVAAAGVNPLTHFDNGGWAEGRDPGAGFDVELYLLNNPDVAAAGVDPLAHYLNGGRGEGRVAYDAIGRSAEIGAGNPASSFDPEYYLLSNPDVARAALDSGIDPNVFAYNHYRNGGYNEGRNPNAYFDSAGYLAAYPDVAAAGIDPLQHYDNGGWAEGRDPSARFDTAAYLAANPDVAAAGIDPLRHFIAGGVYEGRVAIDDGVFG